MWNKKEMSQLYAMLTRVPLILTFDIYLWPWIFKVKLYLGNRRPDCHGTKEMGIDRIPWSETLRKWVNWTLRWLGYLWPWSLTLNFQGQIVSREWEAWFSWNERDGSPHVKHNPFVTLRQRILLGIYYTDLFGFMNMLSLYVQSGTHRYIHWCHCSFHI